MHARCTRGAQRTRTLLAQYVAYELLSQDSDLRLRALRLRVSSGKQACIREVERRLQPCNPRCSPADAVHHCVGYSVVVQRYRTQVSGGPRARRPRVYMCVLANLGRFRCLCVACRHENARAPSLIASGCVFCRRSWRGAPCRSKSGLDLMRRVLVAQRAQPVHPTRPRSTRRDQHPHTLLCEHRFETLQEERASPCACTTASRATLVTLSIATIRSLRRPESQDKQFLLTRPQTRA